MRRHIWKLRSRVSPLRGVSTAAFAFYARHNPTPAEQKAITKYADDNEQGA